MPGGRYRLDCGRTSRTCGNSSSAAVSGLAEGCPGGAGCRQAHLPGVLSQAGAVCSPPPAAAAPGSRCGAGSRAHPPPPLGICKDGARRCEVPSVTPAPAHGQLYLRGHQDGVCKPGVPNLPHKLGAGLPTLGPSPPHDQAGSQTQARPACPLLLPPTEPCPPGGHLGVCPAPWPTHRVCPHPMGGAGKPQLRELKQGAHRSPARLWVGV